jgi:hypothetical protein
MVANTKLGDRCEHTGVRCVWSICSVITPALTHPHESRFGMREASCTDDSTISHDAFYDTLAVGYRHVTEFDTPGVSKVFI